MNVKHQKENIVAIGETLFRLKGFSNTGISDILEACSISKGTFYNYFHSKDEFLIASLKNYTDQLLALMDKVMVPETSNDPLERLKVFVAHMIRGNEQEGLVGGCLLNNMALEVGGLDNELAEHVNNNFKRLVKRVAQELEAAQHYGSVRNDYTATQLAEYMYTGLYGALSGAKMTRNSTPLWMFHQMGFQYIANK